jgi:hypothetical protein
MGLAERFWTRVEKGADCWLWTGDIGQEGYGNLRVAKRGPGSSLKAHRVSYELNVGPIPPGFAVMHTCDVRPCVNPDHLRTGTWADNNRDKAAKGRSAKGETHGTHTHPESWQGERHARAKLTEAQVHEIRRERATGVSVIALGRKYGVNHTTISSIANGKRWRHLPCR